MAGGHVNSVARVGDTVRRSAGEQTPTIHRLLDHARACGVDWVPRPLGFDESGREVLSFIHGDVPHEMPSWIWLEPVLTDVARALRQWHDATVDFDVQGAVWGMSAPEPHQVICHNDFAPYNCVFENGRFVGAIDFDLCSPGSRLWDLGYAAYRFVPLMPPTSDIVDTGGGTDERSPLAWPKMRARLVRFLDAYAASDARLLPDPRHFLATVARRLRAVADWTAAHAAKNPGNALGGHARMYRAHAAWLERAGERWPNDD